MKVCDAMTPDVQLCTPDDTLRDAAEAMAALGVGLLPVADGERLVGMITDRDIAVRAVAQGKGPDTPVSEIMSREVKYCSESDDIDTVAANMADLKLRRLPVVNGQKRLVGIISLGDIALSGGPDDAATALSGISEPGGEHSQSEPGVQGP